MSTKERPSGPEGLLGTIKPILYGVLAGIIVCLVCILLFAALLSSQNMPQAVIGPMATFAVSLGGLSGGFVCAKLTRENGMLNGLLCGAALALVMMLVSFGFSDSGLGIPALFKAVFILLASAIGGIMGVNTRSRKKAPKTKRKR